MSYFFNQRTPTKIQNRFPIALDVPRYFSFPENIICEMYNIHIDFKDVDYYAKGDYKVILKRKDNTYFIKKEKT